MAKEWSLLRGLRGAVDDGLRAGNACIARTGWRHGGREGVEAPRNGFGWAGIVAGGGRGVLGWMLGDRVCLRPGNTRDAGRELI